VQSRNLNNVHMVLLTPENKGNTWLAILCECRDP